MSKGHHRTYVVGYLDGATSATKALARLEDIKGWLLNGCMPINVTGVRTKPAHGTCPAPLRLTMPRTGLTSNFPHRIRRAWNDGTNEGT